VAWMAVWQPAALGQSPSAYLQLLLKMLFRGLLAYTVTRLEYIGQSPHKLFQHAGPVACDMPGN
jgi:hypothetical protein